MNKPRNITFTKRNIDGIRKGTFQAYIHEENEPWVIEVFEQILVMLMWDADAADDGKRKHPKKEIPFYTEDPFGVSLYYGYELRRRGIQVIHRDPGKSITVRAGLPSDFFPKDGLKWLQRQQTNFLKSRNLSA